MVTWGYLGRRIGPQVRHAVCRRLGTRVAARPADRSEQMRLVMLTLSGRIPASDGGTIWTSIASIMSSAGANIENAAGTFVRIPVTSSQTDSSISSFSVSAFGAHIAPSAPIVAGGQEDDLGCTMCMKAQIPAENMSTLTDELRRRSPLQVYTVSFGRIWKVPVVELEPTSMQEGASDEVKLLPHRQLSERRDRRKTGMVHLFGIDRPGQMARITQLLNRFRVKILYLRIASGVANPESLDFVRSTGGPLAESNIQIAIDADLDPKVLQRELARIGQDIGFGVTSMVMHGVWRPRPTLLSYILRRKAFATSYLQVVDERILRIERADRRRRALLKQRRCRTHRRRPPREDCVRGRISAHRRDTMLIDLDFAPLRAF